MKTLFLDCSMGAAGDMLTAALLELLPDPQEFIREFQNLGIPGVTFFAEPEEKCGIMGTHVSVQIQGVREGDPYSGNGHTSMAEIRRMISALPVLPEIRKDIEEVYLKIADAESHVHGKTVDQIHFHEVGTMDALTDVTAVCMLMHRIAPDYVAASPVHVGSGTVSCAHGILPVPAPATAFLLKGIPVYGGSIQGELCTPTGAALLKHFVTEFGEMPVMKVSSIGYGMGTKHFPQANCLRAMLGTTEKPTAPVVELTCNVDDMTGEQIGFAMECLMEAGALDAYTVNIGMKKSRPGILIQVICREADARQMVELIFRHTSTLGIRSRSCRRYQLDRTVREVETPYGMIRRKESTGYGVTRSKYEYEDLARIAREKDRSLLWIAEDLK